jgi:CheY-like chemotaxis protein
MGRGTHRAVILVVEDDDDLRTFYRSVLSVAGYKVVAAADGIEALHHLDQDIRPQLVILDLNLPRLGGRDVKRELRAHAATQNIPILVITGMDPSELEPGDFQCVIRKPVTADGLIDAVALCLPAPTVGV